MWQKDRVIGQPKPIVTICVKYLTSNSENGTHSKHQKDRQVIYHITTMFVSILLFYFLWLLHAISATSWKGCYMPFRPHLERRKIPCHGGLRLHLYPLGYRVKGEDKRWPWASWFHSASCSINVCRATLMIYVWNKTCFFLFRPNRTFSRPCVIDTMRAPKCWYILWGQWFQSTQKSGGILYTCRWVYMYLCLLQFSFYTDI